MLPAAIQVKEVRMASIYDLEMNSIEGESVELSRYRDQVCLIVNLASA